MRKPHIRKVKHSPYWVCGGAVGDSPHHAYSRHMQLVKVMKQLSIHGREQKRSLWHRIREWLAR